MKVDIKHISRGVVLSALAFTVALSPLGAFTAHAAPGTATWDGDAGDHKFSTAANWVGDTLPVDGDNLVFNTGAAGGSETLINDLPATIEFANLTVDSTGLQNFSSYTTSGNPLQLKANALLKRIGTQTSFYLYGGVNASGNVSLEGSWSLYGNSVIAGTLTTDAAPSSSYGSIGGSYGITGLTGLTLAGADDFYVYDNISFPITVAANSSVSLTFPSDSSYDGTTKLSTYKDVTRTVSGEITLNSNLDIEVQRQVTVNFTGQKTGSGSITRAKYSHSTGVINVGGQQITSSPKTSSLDGSATGGVQVYDKETAVLNGTRDYINVYPGGVLKGNGTVTDDLSVGDFGQVAPGNSPGKITVQKSLFLEQDSIYNAEILNKDGYDQLVVGENFTPTQFTPNAVNINNAVLDLKFLAGGIVNKGENYRIIDNKSTTSVNGTFRGLSEGTKITIGNAVFAISYVGGDGNDVVLTALVTAKAPLAPNTGFAEQVKANPAVVAVAGILSVLAIAYAARTLRVSKK